MENKKISNLFFGGLSFFSASSAVCCSQFICGCWIRKTFVRLISSLGKLAITFESRSY